MFPQTNASNCLHSIIIYFSLVIWSSLETYMYMYIHDCIYNVHPQTIKRTRVTQSTHRTHNAGLHVHAQYTDWIYHTPFCSVFCSEDSSCSSLSSSLSLSSGQDNSPPDSPSSSLASSPLNSVAKVTRTACQVNMGNINPCGIHCVYVADNSFLLHACTCTMYMPCSGCVPDIHVVSSGNTVLNIQVCGSCTCTCIHIVHEPYTS